METDAASAQGAERDPDSLKRALALIVIGYAALACLALYADYKIRLRRARKKRERAEKKETKKDE